MYKKRFLTGFTLIEVLITLVILLVLATATMAGYNVFLERAREKVCETNLQIILTAVKLHVAKNDTFPGVIPATLSELDPADVKNAYAKVMNEKPLQNKFLRYFVNLNAPKRAYAYDDTTQEGDDYGTDSRRCPNPAIDTLDDLVRPDVMVQHGLNQHVFTCPATRIDGIGVISYGINNDVSHLKWEDVPDNAIVLGDCGEYIFPDVNNLSHRHGIIGRFAHGITKNRVIKKVDTEGTITSKEEK